MPTKQTQEYRMTSDEKRKLGEQIASYIGAGWVYEVDRHTDGDEREAGFNIRCTAKGYGLHFWHDWRDRTGYKFAVSGLYPKDTQGQSHSVNVNLSRGGRAVARDLARRLVGDVEQEYKRRFQAKASSEQKKARTFDTVQQIALALGGCEPKPPYHGSAGELETTKQVTGQFGLPSVSFRVLESDRTARVNLSADHLPLEVALQLAYLLRTVVEKAEEEHNREIRAKRHTYILTDGETVIDEREMNADEYEAADLETVEGQWWETPGAYHRRKIQAKRAAEKAAQAAQEGQGEAQPILAQ